MRRLLKAQATSLEDAARSDVKTRPSPPGGRTSEGAEENPSSHTRPAEDADRALFQKAVGGAVPIRTGGRIEVQRPRPAPVPRPALEAPDDTDNRPVRRHPEDPLRAAYEGVVPLRDRGRVELDTPLRHARRTAPLPAVIVRPDAIVLPADADLHDPADLFRAVIGNAHPVDTRNRVELERPAPLPSPLKREADERAALGESLAAPLTFEDRLDMGDEAAFLRPGLPRRILTDLRRGRWVLQGQIDLHGFTRDEARSALAHFLHASLAQGQRCVRVIHGKGLGSPGKVSILKQLSRGWLAQREEILAFCQAGPHDGGAGALLVLLRAQNATRA